MKTIVQEYGPIYGEPVNGTVLGRPNGSVYIPFSNVISLEIPDDARYIKYTNDKSQMFVCDSLGALDFSLYYARAIAQAQDLSSNMRIRGYKDAVLANHCCGATFTAGLFNDKRTFFITADSTLSVGDTVYMRAQLLNNGAEIAVSDVIELEVV